MTSQTGIRLKFERTLHASAQTVYDALTSKDAIGKWFGPSDDFKVVVHTWDCRVGGSYKVEFKTPAGETHTCHGQFKELIPNKKVSYTWSWEEQPPIDTLVSFVIKANGEKTDLVITHDGFPTEDMRAHHEQGWTGSLERLVRFMA